MAHILILEDDRKTAEFVSQRLRSAGYECAWERSGKEGMEHIKNAPPDLIVLDIMLPGMSGFEVCRQLRRDPDYYTIPILVLSAMSSEEEMKHGLAQGADDYVCKPFDVNNLIQRIEALLHSGSDAQVTDPLTSLPGAIYTKRELQRRISDQKKFAVAYAELPSLRDFAQRCGGKARTVAITRLSQHLAKAGEAVPDFFVGHMGSGHFVCLMPPENAQAFCETAMQQWRKNLEALYSDLGRHGSYQEAINHQDSPKGAPLLDIMFCVTFQHTGYFVSPQQLFEVLSQIRNMAQASRKGAGIYMDRRAALEGN